MNNLHKHYKILLSTLIALAIAAGAYVVVPAPRLRDDLLTQFLLYLRLFLTLLVPALILWNVIDGLAIIVRTIKAKQFTVLSISVLCLWLVVLGTIGFAVYRFYIPYVDSAGLVNYEGQKLYPVNQLMIIMNDDNSTSTIEALAVKYNFHILQDLSGIYFVQTQTKTPQELDNLIEQIKKEPAVKSVGHEILGGLAND